jgi:Ti-type conjugative transfer relaxase TraA
VRRGLGAVLLNIGRTAPGGHDYYLEVVARGVEDYYLARGEAPGRWLGRGVELLGLDGTVDGAALGSVLAGDRPTTGERLAVHPARKVPGFDLTFRAPKSVSLLWALADDQVGEQVREAHDAAVAAAVGYLEREAGWTRRGAGGTEAVKVEEFVGAAFRHRTSRAGDPLLHTHVLVANLTRAVDDGVWRTLDSRRLYAHAKTAGVLYQAHLRHELTRRLGVAFGPVTNGYADLTGVPRAWIDGFSRRRAEIVAHMAARGEDSAKAAQVATLATRTAKEEQPSERELRGRWAARARGLGIDRDWWRPLLQRQTVQREDLLGLYRELVVDEALTEQSSSFARRDVVQAVAARLPAGADAARVVEIADAIVGHDPDQVLALGDTRGHLRTVDVIRRDDGTVVPADADEPRYTTRGLLLTEQRAVHRATQRRHDQLAIVADPALPDSLSAEQAAVVRRLTTSGAGVEVVVGRAGTGKTFALDAARTVWQDAGIPVAGVALAARAALELEESAGIPSTTLARLLAQADDGRGSPLKPGSVLVVDEAAMVGTRQLARLLDHAQAQRVKVVLVGDPHQLPEIDAGGLFRALATRLPAVELTDNRRQTERWEVDALAQFRHGDIDDALDAYRDHGRIVTATDAEALRERLVTDWWDTYDRLGSTSTIMVALRRSDVDDLNVRARDRLAAAGHLTGPELHAGPQTFQAGDRIVCLRNDGQLGVVNGTRATITFIDPTRRAIYATRDDGAGMLLPARYLDAGHVTHGYAITGHKAQGLTVDHTLVLGSGALYREWGYVALSRGRHSNRLYLHPNVDDPELDRHGLQPEPAPSETLAGRLQRSRAEQPVTGDLAARWREVHAWLCQAEIRRLPELVARRQKLTDDIDHLTTVIAREQDQLDRLGRGLGRRGRRLEREELAREIERHRHKLAFLERELAQVETQLNALPDRDVVTAVRREHRKLTRELIDLADQRVDMHQQAPPRYLLATLGTAPEHPHERREWRDAARSIELYRLRWDITDPDRPLGDEPTGLFARDDHRRLTAELVRHHEELTASREPSFERSHGLSR